MTSSNQQARSCFVKQSDSLASPSKGWKHKVPPSHSHRSSLLNVSSLLIYLVTNFLREYLLPSPPSTLLLSSDTLHTIQDPALRIALVRRILRYVSPRPWGSPRAEVDGYSDSLNKMVRTLWKNSHQGFANLPPPPPPRPVTINDHGEITLDARIIADLTFTKPKYHSFTYGSGVLWSPVAILPDGTTRFRPPEPFSNEKLGWLVRREPPWSVKKLENNKMDNTMILDMTSHIRDRTQRERVGVDVNSERSKGEGRRWVNAHRVMYDHRFFVELDLDHIPPDVSDILNKEPDAQVHVQLCEQRYSIPHVVLKRAGCEEMVLGELELLGESKWLEEIRKKRSWKEGMPAREEEPWIRINPIRTWEAI